MQELECKQCGRCCINLSGLLEITEYDVSRWQTQEREDILDWVDCICVLGISEREDEFSYTFPVSSQTGEKFDRCPFLQQTAEGLSICLIYDTRPERCEELVPGSRQAIAAGCAVGQSGQE